MKKTLRGIILLIGAAFLPMIFGVQSALSQSSGCALPSFSAAQNSIVAGGPQSVTNGDFNRDGRIDLATVNQSTSNVTVLLGDGAGAFSSSVNFSVASSPFSVTSGDFNGDGKLDLATANPETNNISVLIGNGAGSFSAASNLVTGPAPFSIEAADFNLDGKLDLATANTGNDTVSIHLGNGVGGFASPQHIAIGYSPFDLTVGDFNRDAKLDLATANPNSDNISVLTGNGLGGFAAPQHYTVSGGPRSIQAADMNGDDKIDLITANESSNSVSVSFQNGIGAFSSHQTVAAGLGPRSVVVGDLNSDGKLDIAASNWESSNVTVILGSGAGQFPTTQSFPVAGLPSALTIADMNRDGKLDLATSNVSVLLNTCNAAPCGGISWNQIQARPPVFFMQSVILADFNEDAKLDIVTGHSFADRIEISYGDGLGGFTVPFRMPVEDGVLGLAVGDFNRESRPDLFTTNLNVDNFSIFLANGIGGFLPRVNYAVGDIPDAPVVADFNSDGKPDVAMVNRGSETISVALNTCEGYRCTDPSFAPAQHFTVGGRLPSDLVAGDFNRDGKIDLATANSWSNSVSLLIGDGLGGFSAPTVINMNSNATFLVTGDFNKDGKLDIVTAGDWGVGVSILIGDGNGGFAPRQTYADGQTQRYSLISNDFNLDGNLDLALSDPNFIFVLFGNGNGGFSPSVKFPGGAADIDTADINADGRPDIVTEGYRVYLNTCIPNVAPVGVDDSFSTNVNAVLTVNASGVLANDTDLYNDPLTATLVSSTTHGTVVLNSNGSFTYTPNTGYSGSDSFTYRAGDGSFTSNIATVSLAVRTINAADDAVNVFENSGPNTLHVLANDFDLIGTPLITSITQTTKGTIAITNGGTDVTYTPNPNYFGADSFQYTITGGNGLTDTATVSISVNSPVGCGVVNFNQRTFYNVGEYPNSIAGGDLNRDGSLDLITANVYAGTVSVLFNTGTGGTFNPVQTFGRAEAGLTTQQAIASDLNSDGFMDMVAVNESIDHVSVFLGTQSGVYAYIEAYVGPSPTQVVVADFNSDGKLDLAATNHNTHTVSIMLGYGSGAFMQPQQFPVSFFPFTIGSADFNNDGKPDVATGNSDGTVSILLGNGTGGFAEAQSFGSNGNIRSVDFADFNRDGNLDIVTASRNSYRVEILVGDGNGGFELYKTFSDVEHTNSIAAGDFNGDRRADIAIASQSGSRPLQLLFGDSEGGFKRESFEQLTYLWNIAAIDINSDGYPDLVGTQVDGASYFVTSINSCAAISRFESDVAGRPWGDGIIQSDDVSLIRRFLSRAYSPNVPEGEFRRADSAPNNTGGDGLIDARDVVQARRYATGTDPIRAAAGPADATPTSGLTESGKDQKHANPEGAVRQLEVLSGQGGRNAHVTLNVLVDAASDESEYAFAINYDPAVLLNPIAGTGNAGALAQNCSVYPIGRLNCSVGEFPNNNPSSDTASIGEIPAGSDQILMTVTFQIAVTAPTGLTPVTFSNAEAANDAASGLLVSGIDGNVDVLAPTAANVSVSGRVLTATGRGLNGVVTMTDMNGNERSTRTNTFGYFTFYNVTAGEAYVVNVRSKGYSFVPQIISVTDNVTELILTLLP